MVERSWNVQKAVQTWQSKTKQKHPTTPEDDVFQVERVLDDTSGGHSYPQDVLLSGHICWISNAIQITQIAVVQEAKKITHFELNVD